MLKKFDSERSMQLYHENYPEYTYCCIYKTNRHDYDDEEERSEEEE